MSNGREPVVETMSGSDTLLWTIGADPVLRQTVVAVLTLDSPPDWLRLRERLNELTGIVPRLRSHGVTRPVIVGRPQFAEDTEFDLDFHVRRTLLPQGSSWRDVLRMAEHMGTVAFDPLLPPWEAMVVEGLEGGRAAIIVKLHHALVDGVGGIAVLGHLLDTSRKAPSRKSPPASPRTEPGSFDPMKSVRQLGRTAAAAVQAAAQPTATARRLMSTGTSVARLLAPAGAPLSHVMTGRSFRRNFEVLDLPKGKLRRAATATGSTLNDVFVTAVVRGLRRYHELHGADMHELRALMPVNVRHDGEVLGGNHFVPARFRVYTGEDASDCLQRTRKITGEWKHASGLAVSEVVATGLSLL
ncbi:MAG TPA: wax ester/triacylglycerol synthase domain-containing protein, partial [Acidimicrobiales bacterium]|nr:wax ester/triacylglycerol synthase domain-containing protein [Acidimicrobiales bacterium]